MSNDENSPSEIRVSHDSVDLDVYITVELVRSALTIVSWNLHDQAKFPDDDPTVKLSKEFLHAWMKRKLPVLEMPKL